MNQLFKDSILNATGAKDLYELEVVQNLWSGYGKIIRYGLIDCEIKSVVVKLIHLPEHDKHPHQWNNHFAHERKIKSYLVETVWYDRWAERCDESCRIPKCYAIETKDDEVMLALEDLNLSGYPRRISKAGIHEIHACLNWLANFHATFMGEKSQYLWQIGTYWHLDTRPDEFKVIDDVSLKNAARSIDQKLNSSPFLTFVHGDAKLANFCFMPDGNRVAAVDFQYVGGGCGMKDIAYFIGSCLYEDECEKMEQELLDFYFAALKEALIQKEKAIDYEALEANWRELYHVAWADFHRFLKGWSPTHWKVNSYSERITRKVVKELCKK